MGNNEKRKKALIITANFWDSPIHVGTHQIANALLKLGWEIGFVSNPISPFHFFGGITSELKARIRLYLDGGRWLYNRKLWIYLGGAFMTPFNKPILSSRFIFENWHIFTFPQLIQKVEEAGFSEVDLIYTDNAVQGFFFNEIRYKKSIMRITDLNKGFESLSPINEEKEIDLLRKVDKVLYTAHSLEDYLQKLHLRNSPIYFPNGVDYEHFQVNTDDYPKEYKEFDGPIVVYVGAISFWFDYNLLHYMARTRPDIHFVIIGDMKKATVQFKECPNIHCLGIRHYSEIPKYIHNADVGLIPFNREYNPEFVDCINPLKLYEYMACGIPVLSRKWKELERIGSPAYLYESKEEAIRLLELAICEKKSKKEIYQAYAREHEWKVQVERLLEKMNLD